MDNRRRITADTALRVSLYFGNSPEFWLNLQLSCDLKLACRNLKPEDAKRIRSLRAASACGERNCPAQMPEFHNRKRGAGLPP